MTPLRATCVALGCVLAALPAAAITGTVIDREKKPIEKARVCYLAGDVQLLCVHTDASGFYELPSSDLDRIRFVADGFLTKVLAAVDHPTPIVLERSAILLVRLQDGSSGEKLGEGKVFLIAPSGRRLGPFPANAAGVRVRNLEPGTVRIVADVEGYEQESPGSAELTSGEETTFDVTMTRSDPPDD